MLRHSECPVGLSIFAAMVLGCGDTKVNPDAGAAKEPEKPTAKVAVDSSTEDYVRIGVPSLDHQWTSDDLAAAVKALSELAKQDPALLPRCDARGSGDVFGRITSPQYLEAARRNSNSIRDRALEIERINRAYADILSLYARSFGPEKWDSEAPDIVGANLRSSLARIEVGDEFLATLDKNDPSYPARKKGHDGIVHAGSTTVTFAISTMGGLNLHQGYASALHKAPPGSHGVRPSNLPRLLSHFEATYPSMASRFSQEDRAKIETALSKEAVDPSFNEFQPRIVALHNFARQALDSKPAP